MGRKIWLGAAGAFLILTGILIWNMDIPGWKKLDTDLIYAQPKASVVYDAYDDPVGTLSADQNRIWVSLDEIPQQVRQAFIAAEDQRFYEHHGVNIRRIFAALVNNIRTRSYSQGASTITQQLIKLTHLSGAKTLSRKAQEAFLALQLERSMSKDEILECYLNTIYFGSGAYGIASASEIYFGKTPAELTLDESALLAGVIKSPSGYAPHLEPERSRQRRNLILDEMAECGFITDDQAAQAKKATTELNMDDDASGGNWFLDAVLEEASDLLNLSVDDIMISGLSIRTAYEPEMQRAADELFEDASNFPDSAPDGTAAQAALVAMDPDTGLIRALVGGRNYTVRRGLNRATQIRRSPGSAIKPISVYAAAIDAHNFTPTSFIEDTPREFDGGYAPGNAGGNAYGTVTLREALSRSLNIAAVDLADLIGVNAVRSYALRFGLELSAQDANLALALGSMTEGVSPAALCGAYASLSNGGIGIQPHLIRSIHDSDGRTLYQADAPSQQIVRPATAFMITDMLKTAASQGSAKALAGAGIPVAAKTGTVSDADGSSRDLWTAAYTPDLALTVWMGFDSPDAEHRLSSSEGGSGYPARLCASFLRVIRPELSGKDFQKPDDVSVILIDRLALEDDEVLLATENTPAEYVAAELFHPDNLPTGYSDRWNAPEPVSDLALISENGETPVLQFTAASELADYLILRTAVGKTDVVAVLTGKAGERLRFADMEADTTQPATYVVLPRHRLLYERGEWITGKESAAVAYSPGGLLGLFQRAPEETSDAPDIELRENQSLFG